MTGNRNDADSPDAATSRRDPGRRKRRRAGDGDGASTTAAAGITHFGIAGGGAILTNQVQPAQPFRSRPSALLPVHDQAGRLIGYAPVHALGVDPAPACAVCASGCPFATIEAAVAAATIGNEIITIAGGAYTLAAAPQAPAYLDIVRPLTLKACVPGQAVTVVCPIGTGLPADCISATGPAAVVTVEGIEIDSRSSTAEEQSGLTAIDGGTLILRDVAVRGFYYGVYAYTGTSATSTVTTSGSVSITTAGGTGSTGMYANSSTVITVGGALAIANATTGLNANIGGTVTCVPPTTYSVVSVSDRCGPICPDTYSGCDCCP